MLRRKPEAQPIKAGQPGGVGDLVFGHVPNHLTPGHLAEGAFFHQTAFFFLSEQTVHQPYVFRQMPGHRQAVFLGGQVEDAVGFPAEAGSEALAPKAVQIPEIFSRQLGLHLQPVGLHPVQRAEHPVQPRQDPQMLLDIVQLLLGEYLGGHIPVLDALVGQNGRGETPFQVHPGQPLLILGGDGVVAFPQPLQCRRVHGPQPRRQLLGLGQKFRQLLPGQAVGVGAHLFGGRNDDFQLHISQQGSGPARPAVRRRWCRALPWASPFRCSPGHR